MSLASFFERGFEWITGKVIAGAGLLLSTPRSGSVIMVIVILALVGYFGRNRIRKIIEKIREKRTEKL